MHIPYQGSYDIEPAACGYFTISAFSIILTPSLDTPFPFTVIVSAAYFTSSLFIGLCFFFNDTATTEINTLSLHDALPICPAGHPGASRTGTVPPVSGAEGSRDG